MKTQARCIAIAVLLAIGGCNDSAVGRTSQTEPVHRYVMRDSDGYGYEMAISEDARKAGQAAPRLIMYHYLGRKDQVLQVMHQANKYNRIVAECTMPCEFAKVYSFVGDQLTTKETIRLQPDALLTHVFEDAARGHLEQMVGEQRGRKVTYWVNGTKERLEVAAAENSASQP